MMKHWITAAGVVATLALAAPPAATQEKGAAACLARLKTLSGEWLQKDEQTGKETVLARYRVTAAGSAVEETLFPGAEHEMVTLYHLDGDHLVLTHYCASGNQPRLRATAASTPDRMEFDCISVSNVKSHDENHMHHAVLTFKDANHFSAEWTAVTNGKPGHVAKFNVRRK